MAILSQSCARVLVQRITLRTPHTFSKNNQRRTTSASIDKHNEHPKSASRNADAPAQSVTVTDSDKVPLLQRLGPLTRAANAYDRVQKRRPWATQLCASLCVYFCGDLMAQHIDGNRYDPMRTLRHMTIGAGASIPGYTWFMYLGRHFNYPSFLLSLATKIVVNQLVMTPIHNSYFFAMQSLLSGAGLLEAWERVKNTVPKSFVNSWKLWPAVTAFSFTYIPPQYRFLSAGVVAVGWQSYLSWLNQRAAEDENALANKSVVASKT